MKVFILVAALGLSILGTAETIKPDVEKILDGRVAHCQSAMDQNRVAYVPSEVSVSVENEVARIAIQVMHLICDHSNGGWKLRHPNSAVPGLSVTGEPLLNRYIFKDLLAINVENEVVGQVNLVSDLPTEQISFETPLENLRDEEGLFTLTFFLRSEFLVDYQGETMNLGLKAWGAYDLRFSFADHVNNLELR